MSRLHPVLTLLGLVLLGAVAALLVASLLGMSASELSRLAVLLVPAIVGTVVIALLASRILRGISLSRRYLAIAAIGSLVALANLLVLTRMMLVSAHAATILAVVLTYATAAGLATAFSSAQDSSAALERIAATAVEIGGGDLAARVGSLTADPELDRLGSTIDQMADALQHARDQEQRIERTRRDLITAVSHDLRTPLANLQAMAEAIDERVVDDPETFRRYAVEMRRSVGQLSSLVDDLFEFVRADTAAIEVPSEVATLDEIVDAALEPIRPDAERKDLTMTIELGDVAGTPCSPHLVRVVQNLLANAVRHTSDGGTVRVEAGGTSDALRISVRDSGDGIAEEDLPHVFEPFFRADPARSGNGSGLGLALADRLVRAMGGSITASSARAAGARFDVVIPTDRRATRPCEARPERPRTRSGGRRGSGSHRPS